MRAASYLLLVLLLLRACLLLLTGLRGVVKTSSFCERRKYRCFCTAKTLKRHLRPVKLCVERISMRPKGPKRRKDDEGQKTSRKVPLVCGKNLMTTELPHRHLKGGDVQRPQGQSEVTVSTATASAATTTTTTTSTTTTTTRKDYGDDYGDGYDAFPDKAM